MDLSWRGPGARVAGHGAGSANREAGGSGRSAGFAGRCGEFSGHDGAKRVEAKDSGGLSSPNWIVLLSTTMMIHDDSIAFVQRRGSVTDVLELVTILLVLVPHFYHYFSS